MKEEVLGFKEGVIYFLGIFGGVILDGGEDMGKNIFGKGYVFIKWYIWSVNLIGERKEVEGFEMSKDSRFCSIIIFKYY